MFSFLNKISGSKKNQQHKTPTKVLSNECLRVNSSSNPQITPTASNSNTNTKTHRIPSASPITTSNGTSSGGGGGGILSGYFTTGRSVHHKKRASLNLGDA